MYGVWGTQNRDRETMQVLLQQYKRGGRAPGRVGDDTSLVPHKSSPVLNLEG